MSLDLEYHTMGIGAPVSRFFLIVLSTLGHVERVPPSGDVLPVSVAASV